MKNKMMRTLLGMGGAVVMLLSGINAYAAPKTMADGTVFDAEYYAETYPDVKAAFGNDEAALYNHYVNFGKAEGRQPVAPQAQSTSSVINDLVAPLPAFSAEANAAYAKKVPVKIGKNDSKYLWFEDEYSVKQLERCRADYSGNPIYQAARNYILQEWEKDKSQSVMNIPIYFVLSSKENADELSDICINLSVDLKKAKVAGTVQVSYCAADGYIHMGRSWENGVTHCMSCIILEDDLRALAEQYQ